MIAKLKYSPERTAFDEFENEIVVSEFIARIDAGGYIGMAKARREPSFM